jgi:glycosyltransferase involved in cell wall biosynthesis
VFYHIGNIIDQRKNFKKILEAFIRLNAPDTLLVVKATCVKPIELKIPNVFIINGLLPHEEIERIHNQSDCYVSFSSSEGIGMGAVEAALHNKPVIITEYGGAVEYIKTPYTVRCELQEIPNDDFLFKKGMLWGKPKFEDLCKFMEDAYKQKLRFMDHSHTRRVVDPLKIYKTLTLM